MKKTTLYWTYLPNKNLMGLGVSNVPHGRFEASETRFNGRTTLGYVLYRLCSGSPSFRLSASLRRVVRLVLQGMMQGGWWVRTYQLIMSPTAPPYLVEFESKGLGMGLSIVKKRGFTQKPASPIPRPPEEKRPRWSSRRSIRSKCRLRSAKSNSNVPESAAN